MGVNGKQKGSRVEREVAKILSKWWGAEFTRTPSSGMFATTHSVQLSRLGVDIAGDIICPKDFPFNVEVKSRKKIDLFDIARNGKDSELWDWWEQSVRDANNTQKIPIVIFKENGKQFYVMLNSGLLFAVRNAKSFLFMQNQYSSNANARCCIFPLNTLIALPKIELLDCLQQLSNVQQSEDIEPLLDNPDLTK